MYNTQNLHRTLHYIQSVSNKKIGNHAIQFKAVTTNRIHKGHSMTLKASEEMNTRQGSCSVLFATSRSQNSVAKIAIARILGFLTGSSPITLVIIAVVLIRRYPPHI
ncbi:unnamed protein product [Microthlaspi erraticum]|uniref:Uncharacterized protein n=1 Tax=Microthlaspi erraticum TaxID=1685480 RepID=A0A6D2KH99_9BRAS|nr:unnamed protein product [Microthlaspi erraticum]